MFLKISHFAEHLSVIVFCS